MIDYAKILSILQALDTDYQTSMAAPDPEKPIIISKMALLEFCGWIEESVDLVLKDYIARKISDPEISTGVTKLIDQNYGFRYKENLFRLFLITLGASNWERIVGSLTDSDVSTLKGICTTYSRKRNDAAHTYVLTGVTATYNAPSLIIADYNKMKPIFQTIESKIAIL